MPVSEIRKDLVLLRRCPPIVADVKVSSPWLVAFPCVQSFSVFVRLLIAKVRDVQNRVLNRCPESLVETELFKVFEGMQCL